MPASVGPAGVLKDGVESAGVELELDGCSRKIPGEILRSNEIVVSP